MKLLKYVGIILVVLLVIFFGRGFLTPEVHYESSIVVEKSAQESWNVMSDQSKTSQWIEGFVRSELISGTGGSVGAVSHNYVMQGDSEIMMKEVIMKVQKHELMTMYFSMDFMDMEYEMTMEEEQEGKTTLVSKSTTKGNSLFARSMLSFMKAGMKKQEDKNMAKLGAVINDNTTFYFD